MSTKVDFVFFMLVAYQIKHFLADYPFQSPRFMLGKFRDDWGFVLPLLAHVTIHGLITFCLTEPFMGPRQGALLSLFDMTMHFGMDRFKAGKNYLGRFKPLTANSYPLALWEADNEGGKSTPEQQEEGKRKLRHNNYFWWSVGFDQMFHHLTHYVIIWYVLTHSMMLSWAE